MAQNRKRKPTKSQVMRRERPYGSDVTRTVFGGMELCKVNIAELADFYASWVSGANEMGPCGPINEIRAAQGLARGLQANDLLSRELNIDNGIGLILKTRHTSRSTSIYFLCPENVSDEGSLMHMRRLVGRKGAEVLEGMAWDSGNLPVLLEHHIHMEGDRRETMLTHAVIAKTLSSIKVTPGPYSPDVFRSCAKQWGQFYHSSILSPDAKRGTMAMMPFLMKALANPQRPLPMLVYLGTGGEKLTETGWVSRMASLWEGSFCSVWFDGEVSPEQFTTALTNAGLSPNLVPPTGGARMYMPYGTLDAPEDHPIWTADQIDPSRADCLTAFALAAGQTAAPFVAPENIIGLVEREDRRREEAKLEKALAEQPSNQQATQERQKVEKALQEARLEAERANKAVGRAEGRSAELQAQVDDLNRRLRVQQDEFQGAREALRVAQKDLEQRLAATAAQDAAKAALLARMGDRPTEGLQDLVASEAKHREEAELHAAELVRLEGLLRVKTQELADAAGKVVALEARAEALAHKPVPQGGSNGNGGGQKRSETVEAVLKGTPTLEQALLFLQEAFPGRLVVLASALESARAAEGFQYRERAFQLLVTLVTDFWAAFREGGDARAREVFGRGDYAATESDGVIENTRATRLRTFRYRGEPVVMLRHLKIGWKDSPAETLRVHFHWDAEEGKIVIGHAGAHLDHD